MCPRLPRAAQSLSLLCSAAWDSEELGYSRRACSARHPAKSPACGRWEVTRRLLGKEGVCPDPTALTPILPGSHCPCATRTTVPGPDRPPGHRHLLTWPRNPGAAAGKPGPTSGLRPIGQKSAEHLPRLREAAAPGWPGETRSEACPRLTGQKSGLAPQGPTDLVQMYLPTTPNVWPWHPVLVCFEEAPPEALMCSRQKSPPGTRCPGRVMKCS